MFVDYYIYVSLHICKCPLTIVNGMSRIEVILHNTLIDAIYVAGGLRGRWTTGHCSVSSRPYKSVDVVVSRCDIVSRYRDFEVIEGSPAVCTICNTLSSH